MRPQKKDEIILFHSKSKKWFKIIRNDIIDPSSIIEQLDIHFIEKNLINYLHCSKRGGELNYLPGNRFGATKIERMLQHERDKVVVYSYPIDTKTIQ